MNWMAVAGLAMALSAGDAAAPQLQSSEIREFDVHTVESLGRSIYRQDSAAWVATDALLAKVPDLKAAGILGWIVEDSGGDQRVRFLRETGGQGLEVAYDVVVSPGLSTTFSEPENRMLTRVERAMFAARQSAIRAAAGVQICRPGYNTVVLPDPERQGWLVWLLAPVPKANVVPVGIHYRFTVSADGQTVLRRDALSRACGDLDPADAKDGGRPAALALTHLVSANPVETEVFLQLQAGIPFYVISSGKVWVIDGGHLRQVDPKPK